MSAQKQTTDIVATKTTTALAVVTSFVAEISTFEEGIAALENLYKGVVYDVKDRKGMDAAKEARQKIRQPRYALQNLEKKAKKTLNDLKDSVASQNDEMLSRISAIEDPIDEQIKNEESRAHNEAVARATAERERVERLEARLDAIRLMPYDANGLSSKSVRAALDEAKAIVIGDDWQEFKEKATGARIGTVASLEGVLAKAEAAEAEAARVIAERAELAKLRAEQLARDAEARQAQEAENARIAAEQKAEAARLAAVSAELERAEREAASARKIEQDKIDADRKALADEQARLAAEQAERIRIDNVNFRAHHERMNSEQRDQLRSLSDTSPAVDVFALPLPTAEPEIVLTESAQPALESSRPTDDQIIECIAREFSVTRPVVLSWLIEMRL